MPGQDVFSYKLKYMYMKFSLSVDSFCVPRFLVCLIEMSFTNHKIFPFIVYDSVCFHIFTLGLFVQAVRGPEL